MNDLSVYDTEELERELERRKEEEEREATRPIPLGLKDFESVVGICRQYVNTIHDGGWVSHSTTKLNIANETLRAVYGPHILSWIEENAGKH